MTPEAIRKAISAAVGMRQARGDKELFLVNGALLLPGDYFSDGLHPDDRGMRELALNLNAQMGFAPVQYEVIKCPQLTLAVRGLTPGA
eukprot:5780937-Prymnesium_polylepis.1